MILSLLGKVEKLKQSIRWGDWAIDKIPVLYSVCFYLIYFNQRPVRENILDFFIFLVFSLSSTIYGFSINDYADLEIDKVHGKKNIFIHLSSARRFIILAAILIIVFISGGFFLDKPYFIILWIIQFSIATFYSLPPIRFKERGLIGLIIPFFAQLVLPTLICFSVFADSFSNELIFFLVYSIFKGGAYDIGHQFHDHIHDVKTKTTTFAVQHGKRIVNILFNIFLILERFTFFFILLIINDGIYISIQSFKFFPLIILIVIDVLLMFMVFRDEFKRKSISDPYYQDVRGLANLLHIIIPNIIFPATILLLSCIQSISYVFIFLFFLIWIFPTPTKLSWPMKLIEQFLKRA